MDLVANVVPYVLVLLIAGVACAFINTLASAGSAISLPMLITLGLPALDANATNRLPVLFGSLMALRTFHAAGKVDVPYPGDHDCPRTHPSQHLLFLSPTGPPFTRESALAKVSRDNKVKGKMKKVNPLNLPV
jgi:hypothetical protein